MNTSLVVYHLKRINMESLKILITLASVLFITVEESSAQNASTLGNEIPVENSNMVTPAYDICDTIFMCPGIDYRALFPRGSLEKGLFFPPSYANNMCRVLRLMEICSSMSPALNVPTCDRQRKTVDFIGRLVSKFCTNTGVNELAELVKCANNKKVQVYMFGVAMFFGGSMTTIGDLVQDMMLNTTLDEFTEIRRQLQCRAVQRFAENGEWQVSDNCGHDAAVVFQKLAKLFAEYAVSTSPYGSCPSVLADLFVDAEYNSIPLGRKKRSVNIFPGINW